jgi:hypothetical protein
VNKRQRKKRWKNKVATLEDAMWYAFAKYHHFMACMERIDRIAQMDSAEVNAGVMGKSPLAAAYNAIKQEDLEQ